MTLVSRLPGSIAHYNLLERIGEGGLGEVYRARDTKVGRTVALTVVESPAIADREAFLASLEDAAALSHPNIATLFDFGEEAGKHYIAHEFVSGITLRQEIGGRPVNPRRALELSVQIADALAEGHAHEIVHGDLRPDTVMVTGKGSAKIADFGLARWTRGGRARAASVHSPESLGSDPYNVAPYLSPEQALGSTIDARSDLFSAGSIVYEMLTGRAPFAAHGPSAAVLNVIRMTPSPPSVVNPALPQELDAIVLRTLVKDLAGRYQSAASLGAELRSMAAMLDVRSGDGAFADLIPLDEDKNGRSWIVLALLAAVAMLALWYWLRG